MNVRKKVYDNSAHTVEFDMSVWTKVVNQEMENAISRGQGKNMNEWGRIT